MNIVQLILLSILSSVVCLEQTGCPASVPTVSNVHRCPGNISEWVKASERKRCSFARQNCSEENEFQYHCLINREINGMVEVCAPIRRIVGYYCPFYNSNEAKIKSHYHLSCKEDTIKCPKFYQSNDAHKYQGCYMAVYGQRISNTSKNKESENNENEFFRKVGDKVVDLQKDTNWILIAIIFSIVFLGIFGVITVVVMFMREDTKKACTQTCPFPCCKCCYTDNDQSGRNNSIELEKQANENDNKDGSNTLPLLGKGERPKEK